MTTIIGIDGCRGTIATISFAKETISKERGSASDKSSVANRSDGKEETKEIKTVGF